MMPILLDFALILFFGGGLAGAIRWALQWIVIYTRAIGVA